MVWVDNESGNAPGGKSIEGQSYRDEAIKGFNELLKTYKPSFLYQLDYKLRKGKVYQEVAHVARSIKAGIIVTGTHGVTGYETFWIGSNAYRIVSYAPCPVITVRFDFPTDIDFSTIVLPIDSTTDTRLKIPFACDLARQLNSAIHIVGSHNTGLLTMKKKTISNMEHAVARCKKLEIPFQTIEMQSSNLTNSVISYAVEHQADIIAIMTEQERSATSLLLGPQAQQMINFSPIPVLSIQPREISSLSLR